MGYKVGCFRPVTLNPFPLKTLAQSCKNRRIFTIELDAGQFADDMRLQLVKCSLAKEAASIRKINRMGGEVVSVDQVVEEITAALKESPQT